jgi:hypothetical protein
MRMPTAMAILQLQSQRVQCPMGTPQMTKTATMKARQYTRVQMKPAMASTMTATVTPMNLPSMPVLGSLMQMVTALVAA